MIQNLEFLPDAARARALDANMHRELGLSLQHVCDACRTIIPFEDDTLARLTASMGQGATFRPSVFGRYYALVQAIREDNLAEAGVVFKQLATAYPAAASLEIVSLGDQALAADRDLYLEKLNADPSVDLSVEEAAPDVAAAFVDRLHRGLALLDRELPALSAEIRGIVRQIVIVTSDPKRTYQFDGGSHFQLWGALFLNGAFHPTEIDIVEVLAHECAHSLLFGFCTDEPLVRNDDDERFASPLRVDLRPMDGIYHATFVSARMHWAMSQLSRSVTLTSEQRDHARAAARTDLSNFQAGYGVVAEHGVLTEIGHGLMRGAKRYIDSVV